MPVRLRAAASLDYFEATARTYFAGSYSKEAMQSLQQKRTSFVPYR